MFREHQSSSSPKPNSSFVSIPNLSPLLRSYNIPAPVIDPTRTDPYSFLNPNPHCDKVPETLFPMDVDPCVVASRSEIVTKTIELTASEHAGVSLTEPTMGSTTSDSPTNSEVVAPQTLNDVVVTKNTKFIICDVCNQTCNSENAFKRHVEGKIHLKSTQKLPVEQETQSPVVNDTLDQESEKKNQDLKNTQKLLVSSNVKQETTSLVANDTLDQESEKKNQGLFQNEASVNPLFICGIPEPGCDYPKIVIEQVDKSLCRNGVPKPTSVSTTPVQTSLGGTQNGPTKLNVHQPMWCHICRVSCSSNKCFEIHIAGKQHLKNLKFSEKPIEDLKSIESEIGDSEDGKTTWCEICKISCTSNDFKRHVSGKKHMKNLQKLEKIPNLPTAVTDLVTTLHVEKMKLTKGEVVNPNEGNSTRCELCEICCTSPDELSKHISGRKHQKNLKKSEKQFVHSPAPVAKRSLQEPMNEEGKVISWERSKRKDNGSLTSDEDADTKRQKMMNEEEGCNVLVTCKVCDVVCNGLTAFKTHLAGFEHSAMALKQTKAGSNGRQV